MNFSVKIKKIHIYIYNYFFYLIIKIFYYFWKEKKNIYKIITNKVIIVIQG